MIKKISLSFLLILTLPAYAEIYKWVDEQGNTHYGDKPVEESEQIDVDVTKKGHMKSDTKRDRKRQNLLDSMSEDRQRVNKEKAEQKKKKKTHKRRCAQARDRLKSYQRAGFLYDLDKEGNRVAVPDEVRKNAIDNLSKNINKFCK